MNALECVVLRGGSSKGIYIERDLLPAPGPQRDQLILDLFGSPDARQVDGLGGADKLTSKVAVMGKPTRDDCDVDFLFGQVGTALPTVDWRSNCGNLSAGAALYAVYRNYAHGEGSHAEVAIHQVNTGRKLKARVPLEHGLPARHGDYAIGGVPGTGPRIELDFGDFGGATLDRGLLPTGHVVDTFDIPGMGPLEASVVDAANLCIFVRAADFGLDAAADVEQLQADPALVRLLDVVRGVVSEAIGFASGDVAARMQASLNPLLFLVGPATPYKTVGGRTVEADQQDITARSFSRTFSKAYPVTGAVATAAACGVPGSIAHQAARLRPTAEGAYDVRIGHPAGVFPVRAEVAWPGGVHTLRSAVLGRTARVLMEGRAALKGEY